jgi:BASS family bile acid:Na+ symporter
MLVLVTITYGRGVLDAVGSHAILTQALFVALVTVVADLAGAVLSASQRNVLTVGMATRNIGAALAPRLLAQRCDS